MVAQPRANAPMKAPRWPLVGASRALETLPLLLLQLPLLLLPLRYCLMLLLRCHSSLGFPTDMPSTCEEYRRRLQQ